MYKLPLLVAAATTVAGAHSLLTGARSAQTVSPSLLVGLDTPFDKGRGTEMSTLMVPLLFSLAGLTLSLITIAAFNWDLVLAVGVGLDPGALWPIPSLIGP